MKKIIVISIALAFLSAGSAFAEWQVTTRQGKTVIGTIIFGSFNDFEKMFPEEAALAEELVQDAMHPEEIRFYVQSDCGEIEYEFGSNCETDMECVETYPFLEFSLESNSK
jgi:hypothetical protein